MHFRIRGIIVCVMILFLLFSNGGARAGEAGFTLEVIAVNAVRQDAKRVFIYHTHTYEAYEQDADHPYKPTERWRTADERYNMIRVGEELASQLRAAGIDATHDTTVYETPRLSTAYSRSLKGVEAF